MKKKPERARKPAPLVLGPQRADKGTILVKPTYHITAAHTVSAALKRVPRRGVVDGTITTLRQFIQEQERQQAELETLIAPLDGGSAVESRVEGREAVAEGNYTSEVERAPEEATP